ncbi:hypothetical protein DAEQUDRAFT_692312 [Daedalea quercina L-15889]|uniref:Ubiquitin 3 binding protein But2 C-terminal domain-containing protein n=1 Tax=Daedalea quercina L-15889 TaxID=1314783 RepID=A0A165PUL9_9APHY|nr:hypothetical protein DAEQUDRAFT_692312 [Daedalea quercina L-15889]
MLWSWRSPRTYAMLSDSSDDGDHAARVAIRPSPIYYLLAIVCVFCAIINTVLFVRLPAALGLPGEKAAASINIADLRRPSQYIQLDFVERPSPPHHREFDNHPILVSIIDSQHPQKVGEVDARRYMSHNGMISPAERHVIVTDTMSTVIQFRAIDYGMELCEIHVHLPPLFTGPSTEAEEPSVVATLYRLNSTRALDERKMSFASRPPRLFKVDDITITPWHYRFSCTSEEVLTFELSHPSFDGAEGTHIEWWQDDDRLQVKPALFMKQHSTK